MSTAPKDSFVLDDSSLEIDSRSPESFESPAEALLSSPFSSSLPPRGISLLARLLLLFRRWQFAVVGFASIFLSVFLSGSDWRDFRYLPVPVHDAGRVVKCEKTNVKVNGRMIFRIHFAYPKREDSMRRDSMGFGTAFSTDPFPEESCKLERCGSDFRPVGTSFGPLSSDFWMLAMILACVFGCLLLTFFGIRSGLRELQVLRWGKLCQSRVLRSEPTSTKINHQRVYHVFFAFESYETGETSEAKLSILESELPETEKQVPLLVGVEKRILLPAMALRILKISSSGDLGAKAGKVLGLLFLLAFLVGLNVLFAQMFQK